MYNISSQNITLSIIWLGIIFILLLSMKSSNKCTKEGFTYQKMFDKSNKVLCPYDDADQLFNKKKIIKK